MRTISTGFFITLFLCLLQGCEGNSSSGQPSEVVEASIEEAFTQSILQIMVDDITPATIVLWGADNPQTDSEWQLLEDAAIATITASKKTALGGIGPQDADWVADPAYQAMNQLMLDAAESYLVAIQARNVDALFDAGDLLYAPCEACHLQFNPAVTGLPQ